MSRSTRRIVAAASALAAAGAVSAAAIPVATAAPAAKASSCRAVWGSGEKGINLSSTVKGTPASAVRTGHHACYDRVVFELAGKPGKTAAVYVPGTPKGTQVLAIGAETRLVPVGVKVGQVLPTTFTTVRGVVYAGNNKGVEAVGVVTRARLPYRIFIVKGPGSHNRIVVDVAHRW